MRTSLGTSRSSWSIIMDFLWSVTFPVQSLLTCWVISEILCNVVNWISIEERLFFFLPHFYSFHFFLSSVHNCEDHFHIHINFILLRSYIYRHARVRSYTSTCFRWHLIGWLRRGRAVIPFHTSLRGETSNFLVCELSGKTWRLLEMKEETSRVAYISGYTSS